MPGSAALANKRSISDGTQSRERDGGGSAAGQLTAMSGTGHEVGPTRVPLLCYMHFIQLCASTRGTTMIRRLM